MYHHRNVPICLTVLILLALLLSSALVVAPVSAADHLVVTSNADDGDGSLRQAIDDISPGGTITFSHSLSGQTITLVSELVIVKNLTIDGVSLEVPITISGNDTVRVFVVYSFVTDAKLKHLTISDGNSSDNPGLTSGGGIQNTGQLTLINCTFTDHQTDWNGGAIWNSVDGTLTIENSHFYRNQSKYNGGAIVNDGTMIVRNSIFTDNHSYDPNFASGGGIANFGTLEISASSIMDNSTAFIGGGLYNAGAGNLTMINSTLSGNTAKSPGGGIYNGGTLTVTNSTLSGNESEATGGGIRNVGTLTLINTIIAYSTNGNCFNTGIIHADSTHNLVMDGSCYVETNLSGDPKLGPLADNGGPTLTHALLPGSPAIDAGSGAHCPDFDQRGVPRPQGAGCDIGAYELETLVVTNTSNHLDGSLRKAIALIPPGGRITFSPNLSGQTITLSSNLVIEKSLTIDGSDLSVPISISGNNTVGVFMIGPSGEVTLDSLNVINGNNVYGGGIYNWGNLTNINCTIADNFAQEGGGGIFNSGNAYLLIMDSTLSNNTTEGDGGGIFNMGYLEVVNSTFNDNSSVVYGGGIYNDGTLTLNNAILSGNTTRGYGGGIYTIQTLNMTDSTLSGNSAYDGGGIYNHSNLEITKSTLSGNTAIGDGGGIVNVGPLTITNSTLSGNHSERGGGILNDDSLTLRNVTLYGNAASASKGGGIINFNGSTLDFINTIIAHSTGGDCVINGTIDLESTHNLVTDGSCGALLDNDPMLGPLANNGGPTLTHSLLPGSPAIDAGSMAYCPNTDQRGFYRPFDGNKTGVAVCDIGAFEFNPAMDGLTFIYLPLLLH